MKVILAVLALLTSATAQAHSAGGAVAVGHAAAGRVTPAQIRAAVRRAERSPNLWATINICNARNARRTVGIRGQMPALGLASTMAMDIQVQYFKKKAHRFVLVPHRAYRVPFGRTVSGLYQGGYSLRFTPGLFRAQITFTWTVAKKVVGQVVRTSVGGRKHVDYSDPPGYSAATCRIG